jgi:sugar/nucleoside kinase (ribokinase family)
MSMGKKLSQSKACTSDERIDYLAIGHLTMDTIDGRPEILGGSVIYAAMTAQQLGARVGIYTSAAEAIDVAAVVHGASVQTIPAQYSTTIRIQYDAYGRRRQVIARRAEKLTVTQLPDAWRSARLIHFAPECDEIDLDLLDSFPNSFVAVTPQGWLRQLDEEGNISPRHWAEATRVLARANAVVISEEDVSSPEILEQWANNAAIFVVTRAKKGCDVCTTSASGRYHSAAFESKAEVDPTGAGDVFAAAYFWWLVQGGGAFEGADWANCVASFAVEQHGCSGIPALEAVARRWAEQKRRLEAHADGAETRLKENSI